MSACLKHFKFFQKRWLYHRKDQHKLSYNPEMQTQVFNHILKNTTQRKKNIFQDIEDVF